MNYAVNIVLKYGNSSKGSIEIRNDLKKNDSFYYLTLKELFTSKFSYLENSIFKDIYQFMLYTLRTEYKRLISNRYREQALYEDYYKNNIRKIKKI